MTRWTAREADERRAIEQARAAMAYSLDKMNAGDTFQIVKFSGHAETCFAKPMPATASSPRCPTSTSVSKPPSTTKPFPRCRATKNYPSSAKSQQKPQSTAPSRTKRLRFPQGAVLLGFVRDSQ